MALRTAAYYRRLADDSLSQLDPFELPVPIERLAENFGIPLLKVTMPSFFFGAIINQDGLPAILVNSAKDERLQRATIAHMIGHVLIVLADPEYSYPRDRSFEHSEADLIADELVMPAAQVAEQARTWFNDHRYLARMFGVDEQDMLERLQDLGIIKARGIMWEY